MWLSQDLNMDMFWPSYDEEAKVEGDPDTAILGEVWGNEWEESMESTELGADITEEVNNDLFWAESEPIEWAKNEAAVEEIEDETQSADAAEESTESIDTWDSELDALLASLDEWSEEIEEKVEELKDDAEQSWNSKLMETIDELQGMLTEKSMKVQELTKQLEITNTNYLDRVWESEWLAIYKNVIDNLESNPNLMLLAKYHWTDNEKIKTKMINIVSDLVMEYTWEDISELINQKQADSIWDLGESWDWIPPIPEWKEEGEDKDWDREQSITQLF